jgi:hypothetical protein
LPKVEKRTSAKLVPRSASSADGDFNFAARIFRSSQLSLKSTVSTCMVPKKLTAKHLTHLSSWPGFVPAMHVFFLLKTSNDVPGTSSAKTRLALLPGHDELLGESDFCPSGKSPNRCPAPREKIFSFSSDPNHRLIQRCLIPHEGALAIVTNVGMGCGGRKSARRRTAQLADGEVVWS